MVYKTGNKILKGSERSNHYRMLKLRTTTFAAQLTLHR